MAPFCQHADANARGEWGEGAPSPRGADRGAGQQERDHPSQRRALAGPRGGPCGADKWQIDTTCRLHRGPSPTGTKRPAGVPKSVSRDDVCDSPHPRPQWGCCPGRPLENERSLRSTLRGSSQESPGRPNRTLPRLGPNFSRFQATRRLILPTVSAWGWAGPEALGLAPSPVHARPPPSITRQ